MLCFSSCDLWTSLTSWIWSPFLHSLKAWKYFLLHGHNCFWMCTTSGTYWKWDSNLPGQWHLEQHPGVQGWVTDFQHLWNKSLELCVPTYKKSNDFLGGKKKSILFINIQHTHSESQNIMNARGWLTASARLHTRWDWQNICCRYEGCANKAAKLLPLWRKPGCPSAGTLLNAGIHLRGRQTSSLG